MLGSDHRGQSGISVMGPPDKKMTDGVCALWEKGEEYRMDQDPRDIGWSMLTLDPPKGLAPCLSICRALCRALRS